MKNIKYILFGFIISLLIACTCEEHEEVIPELPSPFLISNSYVEGEHFFLEFNKFINTESVAFNQTIFVNKEALDDLNMVISGRQIQIPLCQIQCESPDCTLDIQLLSAVDSIGIRSREGQYLDGNADGTDGGDFVKVINFKACFLPYVTNATYQRECFDGCNLGRFTVTIDFNEAINPKTVKMDTSLLVSGNNGIQIFSLPQWNDAANSFSFEIISFASDTICSDDLTIVLEGNLITSQKDFLLDGDRDGIQGGTYEITFSEPLNQISQPFASSNTLTIISTLDTTTTQQSNLRIFFSTGINPASVVPLKNLFLQCGGRAIPFETTFISSTIIDLSFSSAFILQNCSTNDDSNLQRLTLSITDTEPIITLCDSSPIDGNLDGISGGSYSTEISFDRCFLTVCIE